MLGAASGESAIRLSSREMLRSVVIVSALVAVHWQLRDITLEEAAERVPLAVLSLVLSAMLITILMSSGTSRAFIYFQF